MEAEEVIGIGRSRNRAASTRFKPQVRAWMAASAIKIAFLGARPAGTTEVDQHEDVVVEPPDRHASGRRQNRHRHGEDHREGGEPALAVCWDEQVDEDRGAGRCPGRTAGRGRRHRHPSAPGRAEGLADWRLIGQPSVGPVLDVVGDDEMTLASGALVTVAQSRWAEATMSEMSSISRRSVCELIVGEDDGPESGGDRDRCCALADARSPGTTDGQPVERPVEAVGRHMARLAARTDRPYRSCWGAPPRRPSTRAGSPEGRARGERDRCRRRDGDHGSPHGRAGNAMDEGRGDDDRDGRQTDGDGHGGHLVHGPAGRVEGRRAVRGGPGSRRPAGTRPSPQPAVHRRSSRRPTGWSPRAHRPPRRRSDRARRSRRGRARCASDRPACRRW